MVSRSVNGSAISLTVSCEMSPAFHSQWMTSPVMEIIQKMTLVERVSGVTLQRRAAVRAPNTNT